MLKVGSGSAIITNELGTDIQGATVGGKARYIRDELEANAICLMQGDAEVMWVSCDLGGLEPDFTAETREAMAASCGLNPRSIILGGTHTGGPSVIPSNYVKPVDAAYLGRLKNTLTELAARTMDSLTPSRVSVAAGHAKIGYNRRTCWCDAGHRMGSKPGRQEDFTGMEGPEDDAQVVLYAVNEENRLTAVLHQNTSHPCTFYGADFYSADYPGLARDLLRKALGNIPVLFFNGAFGDIGQTKFDAKTFSRGKEEMLARCALPLAGETLRLIYENPPAETAEFAHIHEDLDLPVRLPTEERLEWAGGILARVDAGETVPPFDVVFAHGATLLQERFGKHPTDKLSLHAIRIGSAAIVTQPTELFCQFGLDVKRRSPFAPTALFSICDGYAGYCPTFGAAIAGGYSGEPIYWTRFTPEAGYRITDALCGLLYKLKAGKG